MAADTVGFLKEPSIRKIICVFVIFDKAFNLWLPYLQSEWLDWFF